MIAPGRAATPSKRRRYMAAGMGLGLAALIAASPAWAVPVESPTNQAESGAAPRRLAPVGRGPVKPPPAQSSANPRPFRPEPSPPPRPKPNLMPNVTGMPVALAMAILARQGLAASQISPTASDAPANWVVGQQPFPQSPVMAGSPVVLTISNGPPRPALPLPPIYPPQRPPPPAGFGDGVPVQPPAPTTAPSAPPPSVAQPPAAPAPGRAKPVSAAPAASAAPTASPSPASSAPSPSPANPPAPPAAGRAEQAAWPGLSPGSLAALVAALAAGAAGLGWALRRRPPVIPSGPVLPVAPVIVAVSMTAPPHGEIQNVQPPPGPTVAISWQVDPPQTRLDGPSQTPKELKP